MTPRCGRSRLEQDLVNLMERNDIVRSCIDAGRKERMSERRILMTMVFAMSAVIDAQRAMMKPIPEKATSYRPSAYSVHEWGGSRSESPASEFYDVSVAPPASASGGNG